MAAVIQNEFERFVTFFDVMQRPSRQVLEATPEERKTLATRLGVLKVDAFKVRVAFAPKKIMKRVEVLGHIDAILHQECVVTLEPIKRVIKETVQLILTAEKVRLSDTEAVLYEGPEIITCEPHVPVDIGEVFVQYLCLVMDNFPRNDNIL